MSHLYAGITLALRLPNVGKKHLLFPFRDAELKNTFFI